MKVGLQRYRSTVRKITGKSTVAAFPPKDTTSFTSSRSARKSRAKLGYTDDSDQT